MKEANHLAAIEIFEKVNASLLPQNVLDLHGLHVDEAIEHLMAVLQQKTEGRTVKMTNFQFKICLCSYWYKLQIQKSLNVQAEDICATFIGSFLKRTFLGKNCYGHGHLTVSFLFPFQ